MTSLKKSQIVENNLKRPQMTSNDLQLQPPKINQLSSNELKYPQGLNWHKMVSNDLKRPKMVLLTINGLN